MRLRRSFVWAVAGPLILVTSVGRAIDPPHRPPACALSKISDMTASIRAKHILDTDRVLGRLNLSVQVEDGVATISGPVPSGDVAQMAVVKLQAIPDIVEIRHRFYRHGSDGPLLSGLTRPSNAPQRIDVARPDTKTGRLSLPPWRPDVVVGSQGQKKALVETPGRAGGALLFAPRPASFRSAVTPAEREQAPRRALSLPEAVQRVNNSRPEFAVIAVRVDGQDVIIHRNNRPPHAVMELAKQLRKVPGVQDVRLSDD